MFFSVDRIGRVRRHPSLSPPWFSLNCCPADICVQHTTCLVGNRKSWNNGAGYLRGAYHVYAKDEALANGYGGYCHSAVRPSANARYLLPCTFMPHLPHNSSGFLVKTKNWVRSRETRALNLQAMKNEALIPDDAAWDRLRPTPCLSSPPSLDKFAPLVQSWQSGLEKPAVPGVRTFLGGENNVSELEGKIRNAIISGDPNVPNWLVSQFRSPSGVHTIGGSVRANRTPEYIASKSKKPLGRIPQAALRAARAILEAHRSAKASSQVKAGPDGPRPTNTRLNSQERHGPTQEGGHLEATEQSLQGSVRPVQERSSRARHQTQRAKPRRGVEGTARCRPRQGDVHLQQVGESRSDKSSRNQRVPESRTEPNPRMALNEDDGVRTKRLVPSPMTLDEAMKSYRPGSTDVQSTSIEQGPKNLGGDNLQRVSPDRPARTRITLNFEERLRQPRPDGSNLLQDTRETASTPLRNILHEYTRIRSPYRAPGSHPQEDDDPSATKRSPPRAPVSPKRYLTFVNSWIG